jgi:peroxiredoxin Q/BCP
VAIVRSKRMAKAEYVFMFLICITEELKKCYRAIFIKILTKYWNIFCYYIAVKAVDFSLADQNGEFQKLAYYHGKWVVLYFYPKDDTPGCTKEACAFRDRFDELSEKGVVVLGVSRDSVASHKKFVEKYNLNFPLLSDESTETIKAYGAWNDHPLPMRSHVMRKTFLINPQGDIAKEYPKVDPITHAGEILKDLKSFEK